MSCVVEKKPKSNESFIFGEEMRSWGVMDFGF